MKTAVCDAADPASRQEAVRRAVKELTDGGVVAIPTETVYGLAADALKPEAVARIFEAKERPFFDPLIVHLPDLSWLDRATEVPTGERDLVRRLTARFWPGPLTLVLPRREIIPDIAAAGLPTVAVRMSANAILMGVLRAFGKPVAAPSANRFGKISPTTAAHVLSELGGRIPLLLDGGPCLVGVESTIIALRDGGIEILREGPVTREDLAPFAPLAPRVSGAGVPAPGNPLAPGQLKSHYAPGTPLRIVDDPARLPPAPGMRRGLLAWCSGEFSGFDRIEVLSETGDLREAASRLFAAMRRLDEGGLDLIIAERIPETGLGAAIMDRLNRAAHV